MIKGLKPITQMKENPQIALKINGVLKKLGFNEVIYKENFNLRKAYYKKLTLSINPTLHEDFIYSDSRNLLMKKLNEFKDTGFIQEGMNAFEKGEEEDVIIDIEGHGKATIGRYYKNRNLFIFYYPIFYTDFSLGLKNKCLFYLLDLLKLACNQSKIEEINLDEKVLEIMLESFNYDLSNEKRRFEKDVETCARDIKNYQESIINCIRSKTIKENQIKQLEGFNKNGSEKIRKEIEEIKKLPFVKDITLNFDSIRIDVGEIFIKHKFSREEEVKELFIGDFFFNITPISISVDCKKKFKIKDTYSRRGLRELIHPHIRGNDINNVCWGDRRSKIYEYLANFDLKRLVYFLYMWSKSYNENDKLENLSYWLDHPRNNPNVENQIFTENEDLNDNDDEEGEE